MKVNFIQTSPIYSKSFFEKKDNVNREVSLERTDDKSLTLNSNLALVNFPNVSFKMEPAANFLLGQSNRFRCAYSGRIMISPFEARVIYAKLQKRPNAQSAINYLQQYEGYMHDIESRVFALFDASSHKNKKNFQDILLEEAPEALERLKEKQKTILSSVDSIINKLSEPLAKQVRAIRDEALLKMENDTFGRKCPLEAIKKIKAYGQDLEKIITIYRAWYKLPSSGKDIDAFIVSYSKKPHEDIAKRLISSAVATVEHIRPKSCGGEDKLSNYILVSAQYNNERNTMPLWEYIMLNQQIDIKKNLQAYMNDLIGEVHSKKSVFYDKSWYPESLKTSISKQTRGSVILKMDSLNLTKKQKRKNDFINQLGTKYTVIKK